MQRGFTLIAVTIIAALIMIIGVHLISISITDAAISQSYFSSSQAYYLSQAAVSDTIARLNQDYSLYEHLVNGTLSESNSSINRNNVFQADDSYMAYAVSTAPGAATIFAIGNIRTSQGTATRPVRVDIGTAIGSSATFPYVLLAGGQGSRESGNMTISSVALAFEGASLQTNQVFRIRNHGQASVRDGDVQAHQVNIQSGSILTFQNGQIREGVEAVPLPRIDFDSSAPSSWKNRATLLLTPDQFDALPNNTALEGIIFVDGTPDDLQKNLMVRGTLVINGSLELEYPGTLTVMPRPPVSGLLIKDTLELESTATIHGLVYAGHWLEIENDDDDSPEHLEVNIVGAAIGWNIAFSGRPNTIITITYNRHLASATLDPDLNVDSPLIAVNHWEEVY